MHSKNLIEVVCAECGKHEFVFPCRAKNMYVAAENVQVNIILNDIIKKQNQNAQFVVKNIQLNKVIKTNVKHVVISHVLVNGGQ